jgi:hypothetical protein
MQDNRKKTAAGLLAAAFALTTASGALAGYPENYQINYSVMECADVTTDGLPGYFTYWGYENPNRTITYIACPISFIGKFMVDGDLTRYDPGEDEASSTLGFHFRVRVLDTQASSQVWCQVTGSTGLDNDTPYDVFDWESTSMLGSGSAYTGLYTIQWQGLWYWFSDDTEYMFLACGVGAATGTPGNQVIGYQLEYVSP